MEPGPSRSLPEGDWHQQARAMAVTAVDPVRQQRAASRSDKLVRSHVRSMVLFTVAIGAGMAAYVGGVDATVGPSEGGPTIPIVLIPVVAIAFIYGIVLVAFRTREAVEAGDDWLAPLGLKTISVPTSVIVREPTSRGDRHDVVGPTVVRGRRYGRDVEIALDVKTYVTVVGGTYPNFTVTGTGSGLVASKGAPPSVADVIRPLPGSRWKEVEVTGGPEGIRVRRKVRTNQWKDALWLSDLWLAERLADDLGPEGRLRE